MPGRAMRLECLHHPSPADTGSDDSQSSTVRDRSQLGDRISRKRDIFQKESKGKGLQTRGIEKCLLYLRDLNSGCSKLISVTGTERARGSKLRGELAQRAARSSLPLEILKML